MNIKRLIPILALSAAALACSLPFQIPGLFGKADLDNPIKSGEGIESQWGTLRVLSFHRPTAFQVMPFDADLSVTGERPSQPATGAEFVSIELEFACATSQTVCQGPPEAVLELVLADGRVVSEDFVPMWMPWMGAEEIVGDASVTGWVTFEVPQDAEIQALKVTPFEAVLALHAALPEPVDGYAIEIDPLFYEGVEEQELPALRRDLEQAGFAIRWAGLSTYGETGLHITVYTDELFFFEDQEVVLAVQPLMLTAVDKWSAYGEGADYLYVELWNGFHEEVVASVGVNVADIDAYLAADMEAKAFIDTWWVLND